MNVIFGIEASVPIEIMPTYMRALTEFKEQWTDWGAEFRDMDFDSEEETWQ
jgi:hypothetical protein